MCAIMNRFRAIKAAARHRPVFELRIPALLWPGALTPPAARRKFGTVVFNSWLTQPLFTSLANLLQNVVRASKQANSKTIVTEFSRDFLYFSDLLVTKITIQFWA